MASGRLRLHGGGHHVLASLWYVRQQVAQEVHPAQAAQCSAPRGATPAAALEHAPDRCRQPQVGVRDHQPGSSQATLLLLRRSLRLDAAEELPPEDLRLAVTHGDAEHFSVAEGVVALGLPRSGCRLPPRRPAKPPACSAPDGRGGRWHRGKGTGSGHGPTAVPERLSPARLCPWQMRLTSDLEMPPV